MTEKCDFSVLVEKCGFTGLGEKCVFMEMCVLRFFAEKRILRIWWESVFFSFCEKMHFLAIREKCICSKIEFRV